MIAEAHGGRIWAESAGEGQGTALHLWLPADDTTAAVHPTGDARDVAAG